MKTMQRIETIVLALALAGCGGVRQQAKSEALPLYDSRQGWVTGEIVTEGCGCSNSFLKEFPQSRTVTPDAVLASYSVGNVTSVVLYKASVRTASGDTAIVEQTCTLWKGMYSGLATTSTVAIPEGPDNDRPSLRARHQHARPAARFARPRRARAWRGDDRCKNHNDSRRTIGGDCDESDGEEDA